MSEREEHSQLELFSRGREHIQIQPKTKFSNSFLAYVTSYEKIILLVIGFIITGIISFCLGVEKGKTIAAPRLNPQFDIAEGSVFKPLPVKPNQNAKPPEPVSAGLEEGLIARAGQKSSQTKQEILVPAQKQGGGYTIQVATYQMKSYAQIETEKLRKKGFYALILSRGGYNIVCVGNFADMQTAQSSLLKLKQKYRDCYLRRL